MRCTTGYSTRSGAETILSWLLRDRGLVVGTRELGIVLATCTYIAYIVFIWKIVMRFLTLRKTSTRFNGSTVSETSSVTVLKTVEDIVFFPRLFRVNPRLWFGEFLFHIAFSLVFLRHLKYVLNPVPAWVSAMQFPGLCAGYLLPLSLLFILVTKIGIERKEYVSSYNFFLLGLLCIISTTGFLMKTVIRLDLSSIKHFMLNVFRFAPGTPPDNCVFVLHYLMALILLACLPTHIYAAPFTIMEARKREERLKMLMHE